MQWANLDVFTRIFDNLLCFCFQRADAASILKKEKRGNGAPGIDKLNKVSWLQRDWKPLRMRGWHDDELDWPTHHLHFGHCGIYNGAANNGPFPVEDKPCLLATDLDECLDGTRTKVRTPHSS